jgi:hypothetical protein
LEKLPGKPLPVNHLLLFPFYIHVTPAKNQGQESYPPKASIYFELKAKQKFRPDKGRNLIRRYLWIL